MKYKSIIAGFALVLLATTGQTYAQTGSADGHQTLQQAAWEMPQPNVVIKCLELQPAHAVRVTDLVPAELQQAVEKAWPGKTISRNAGLFQGYSLGEPVTLTYEVIVTEPGGYNVVCNTSPELPILSPHEIPMIVSQSGQTHRFDFRFRCGTPGNYCIILSVQAKEVATRGSGGNHVLYFRMDDAGGRLVDAEGLLYEDRLQAWRVRYNSDPSILAKLAFDGASDQPLSESKTQQPAVPKSQAAMGGSVTVTGRITYQDYDLQDKPVRNAVVEIWERDLWEDNRKVTTNTNEFGEYRGSYSQTYDTPDPYIKVFSRTYDNSTGEIWIGHSRPSNYLEDKTGTVRIDLNMKDDGLNHPRNKAFAIFDHLQECQNFFTNKGVDPPPLYIDFPFTGQTTFAPHSDHVELRFSSADIMSSFTAVPGVIARMYGLYAMWLLFDKNYPVSDIAGHPLNTQVSRESAWIHGWADFYAIREGGIYYDANGDKEDLRNTDKLTALSDWDNVPGRVAGALYDLFDSNDDATERWDKYAGGENQEKILATMREGGRKTTLRDFFDKYTARYHAADLSGRTRAYGALTQNAILYDRSIPSAPGIPTDADQYSSSLDVTFSWSRATDEESGIAGYRVKIDKPPGMEEFYECFFDECQHSDGLYRLAVRGEHGQTLYASVQAFNGSGIEGHWSPRSDGITIDTTPPTLAGTPTDEGDFTDAASTTFCWRAAGDEQTGISGYQLQVGTSIGGNEVYDEWLSTELCQGVNLLALAWRPDAQILYARVRARNGAGLEGTWSNPSDGIMVYSALPLVQNTNIPPNSGNVSRAAEVVVTFNKAMLPKLFSPANFVISGSQTGLHPGVITPSSENTTMTFKPAKPFAAGEQVIVILSKRLALAEPYTFSFMIAPAQGAETFAAAPGSPYRLSFFAGDKTRNLVTADYNNDGHLDLLILRAETNHALIFLGQGDGTFKKLPDDKYLGADAWPIYTNPRRFYPQHVATGDLNADGKMDLAVCTADLEPATPDYVLVLYGLGDGWFGSAFPYQVGRDPWNAAIADLNGDGRQDIVVNNHAEATIAVLLGQDQPPSFAAARFYACAHPANALAVGDYNNDARLDLAVVGGDKTEASAVQEFGTVFLGNGDGTFTTQRGFVPGEGPLQLANADCNEDGILDLVVANEDDGFPNYAGSKSISVLLGRGDGRFFPRMIHPIALTDCEPRAVTVADFDKDGHVDVVVAASGTGEIVVLRGDGKGNLANPAAYPVGDTPTSVVAGDFNHDGILDLAAGNYGRKDNKGWYGPGAISVLLGAPAATATETITFGETGNTDFAGVTQDAHIREIDFAQNRNYGHTTRLRVLGANAEKKEWRGLLKFDFVPGLQSRGVNAADQILSAKITLLLAESEGVKEDQLSLHRLLRAWGEGAGDNTEAKAGEVTWLSAKHAQAWWANPGGDYLITPDAVQAVGNAPGTWCELVVTQAVKAMFAANANEGWLLILEPNAGMRYFHASEEYLTPAYRPKLTVVVQPALGKPTGDAELAATGVPQEFRLEQNYPNPFNPETEIGFALPEASAVKLTVFNLLGERVRTLVEQECPAGFHRVIWDGKDERGRLLASGIYLYRLQAGEFVQVKKMSLLR